MKKEYLNEEEYQRITKKLKNISKLILIVGFSIALIIIMTGLIKSKNIEKENEKLANEIRENAIKTKEENAKRIPIIETEIQELNNQLKTKEQERTLLTQEKSKIFMEDHGFSDRYYEKELEINNKNNEIKEITQKIFEKEKEKREIESNQKNYDEESINRKIEQEKKSDYEYKRYYFYAVPAIMFSSIIALSIYMTANRRKIMAYTTQTTMPIAQEGMEKMAPTVANVAKNITEGIKEGLKDDEDEIKKQ